VRNVCRTVWISVPEDSQASHDEKMACIKLLVAFVVATKHHLREEFGTDYYDLDVLLPKNWIPAAAGPDIRVVANPSQPPLSAPAGAGQAALASQNAHPDTAPQGGGGDNPNDPVNMPIGSHEPQISEAYRDREDLPDESDSDMSLPMEILFRIGLYVSQSRARPANEKPMDPGTAGTIMGGLNTLTDCLGSFERILYTPIPKAYTIHLKQAIILYIFALPFTLVKELHWFVIPMIGLVSFTLLGIEGIGSEIENPFGYDANDLPLNQYCEEIKKEVEYIIYHVPSRSQSILLEGR